MTDPLDALREPSRPVDLDPRFARRLRERLERALLDPKEDEMSATTTTAPARTARSITAYLAVVDTAAALDFYTAAFGGVRRGEPITMPDGRIGHAEIALGDSVLMMADEFPELGLAAPVSRGGPSQSLVLEVADPDAVVDRAIVAGARLERPVADSPYGRGGVVVDPSGHRWMVTRAATRGPRAGDVGYASLWTRDIEAAQRFYAAVLGWTTTAGSAPQGRQVTNLATPLGIWGGRPRGTLFVCWAVPDVDAAVELVRAAGGTAEAPTDEPYGRLANCVDDQGLAFAVFTPPGGPGAAPDTTRPGELTYLILQLPDSGRARAFYGTVLGWRFVPGRAAGNWNVLVDSGDTHPRAGLSSGPGEPTVVPMFAVADIAAAVVAVRAAGGTADDPALAGYGTSSACVDDQDAQFWLVQY